MDRGFQIAVVVLCFLMAAGTLSAMGIFAEWGVGISPGEGDPSDDLQEDEDLIDPTLDTNENIVESFVDTVLPGLGVLSTLADGVRGTGAMLSNLGVPSPIASPIAAVVLIAVAISFAKFVRGVS